MEPNQRVPEPAPAVVHTEPPFALPTQGGLYVVNSTGQAVADVPPGGVVAQADEEQP